MTDQLTDAGNAGLTTDHSRATTAGAHTHGPSVVPEASRAQRRTSFALEDFPVPTGREEEWRFTPITRITPLLDATGEGLGSAGV